MLSVAASRHINYTVLRQVLRLFVEKNGKKRDVYIKADKGDLFFRLDKHEFDMTLHALP